MKDIGVVPEEKEDAIEEEIRMDSFLRWVWRGKWLILILVILAGGSVVAMRLRQPTMHTATALIEVGKVWSKPLKDIFATTEMARTGGFIEEVAAKTGVKRNQLGRSVQVQAVISESPHARYPILVRVTATTGSADESVGFAQAMADEIILRHQKLFDEAIAPHIERQRQLEQQLKEVGSLTSDREFAFKVRTELDDVIANNTSPTLTERTRLVERVVVDGTSRPSFWRDAAIAGLIAAMVGVVAVCLIGYLSPVRPN